LGALGLAADDDAVQAIARAARGDARRALTMLEGAAEHVRAAGGARIDRASLAAASEEGTLLHDKTGDQHYDVTSAFIKSLRGSDPDAAIYWMMRMLEAG